MERRSYARIAPSVPHALHMPSHIFSRVGLWPAMVEANRASYLAAKNELSEETLGRAAERYYSLMRSLTANRDSDRGELAAAEAFLAKR